MILSVSQQLVFYALVILSVGFSFALMYWKKKCLQDACSKSPQRRSLVNSGDTVLLHELPLSIRKENWKNVFSVWKKNEALNFEKLKVPLVGVLKGHEKPSNWKQPMKIGALPIQNAMLKEIEHSSESVFNFTSLGDDESVKTSVMGLSGLLQSSSLKVLIIDLVPAHNKKDELIMTELNTDEFTNLPKPMSTRFSHTFIIDVDSPVGYLEEELNREKIGQLCLKYKELYNTILFISPNLFSSGIAKLVSEFSNQTILFGTPSDHNQAQLCDAQLRLENSNSVSLWGVIEEK